MDNRLISLVEQRVHARLTSEEEAEAVLQWIATREGRPVEELIRELGGRGPALP